MSCLVWKLRSRGLVTTAEELEDFVDDGAGVATGEHLTNDSLGLVPKLNRKESPGHRFVRAGLPLVTAQGVVNALGLVNVLLRGPAVDESVGDVRSNLNAAATHLLQDRLGVSNAMVGNHGLEECLENAGVQGNELFADDVVEHPA